MQSRARGRPAGFNVEAHVDLKYMPATSRTTAICSGTNKHTAVLPKTRKPAYVAKKFIKHLIAPFGRPIRIVMDQKSEFERERLMMLVNYGVFSTTTGLATCLCRAPRRLVRDDMAGSSRGDSRREPDMAIALAGAIDAKNELVTRQGYTPNMLVFGKQVSFPELLGEQEYDPVTQAQSLNLDTEFAKRATTRHQARQILLRDDVQQKLKRALTRKPTNRDCIYRPADVIYFFVPNPMKPRHRQDHGRWRGPAVVILQEAH